MDNQRGIPAIFNYPMTQGDFQLAQEARIQNALLTDPEMVKETVRLRNYMEKENHKSALRQQEVVRKQRMKVVITEIYQLDYGGRTADRQWRRLYPPEDANLLLQDRWYAAFLPCQDEGKILAGRDSGQWRQDFQQSLPC